MNHIRQVFTYELGRNLRRRGYLFATFGIPIIALLLLVGYHFVTTLNQDGSEPQAGSSAGNIFGVPNDPNAGRSIGYVDLANVVPEGMNTEIMRPYADESAAQAALEAGEIDSYYVIAADYWETGDVTLILPTLSMDRITEGPVRNLIQSALREQIDDEALYFRLVDPSNVQQVNVQREAPAGSQDFGASFLLVYVFVIALMLSLFMTNGYLLQAVIEEKENRVVEILISTLRPSQLLIGKILAYGVLGLFQLVVWVAALLIALQLGQVLEGISILAQLFIPMDALPLVLLFFLLAYLMFAAGYGIIGALSTSMREGPQFVVVFTLPAVIPLYFITSFIETPDATLPVILSLIPITAPLAMTMRLLVTVVPLWQIGLSIGLLVLMILFLMWLAGRLFRVQILLSGQLPRLRDIPRLMRG